MAHYTILGKDPYWMNFIGLMVLTLIEVVAVGFHLPEEKIFVFSNYTLMILTVVAIPKFIMIAMIFMHLYGEEDSGILTVTALFPSFFIIIMIAGEVFANRIILIYRDIFIQFSILIGDE